MSDGKRQSLIMTGIGLILVSLVLLYFGLSQPRVSESKAVSVQNQAITKEYKTHIAIDDADNVNQNNYDEPTRNSQYEEVEIIDDEVTTAQKYVPDYPLDLNTCTIADLTTIKGIGETRADAIIQYREYLGGYTSVEQIKDIKGFGDSLYEKVADYLTV